MHNETILWIVAVVGVILTLVAYVRSQLRDKPEISKDEPIASHTAHAPEMQARPGVYVHPYVSAPVYTPPRAAARPGVVAPKTNAYGELED